MLPLSASLLSTSGDPLVGLCAHCGSRIPGALAPETRFCCAGCETVHDLLGASGLDEYYSFRERLGASGRPVETAGALDFRELDSEAFRALYVKCEGETERVELSIEGLHCAACVWLIERAPRLEPQLREARVDFGRGLVELTLESGASVGKVAETLARLGYRPSPFRAGKAEAARRRELRGLLLRMGVAGAIAGNVMLMAFSLYSGAEGTMDAATRRFFEIGSFLLSLPALWAAGIFFRGAVASIRLRAPHMDLPIAIGIAAGYGAGTYAALTGSGEIYFDSLTVLIFLLLIGRYLTRRHQMTAAEAAELIGSVTPSVARVRGPDGAVVETPIGSLAVGSVVEVRSGETVPVDGVVRSGASSLDLSILSGESLPVVVGVGSEVPAGATNVGGALLVETTRAGAATRVAELMREVERALYARSPLVAQADRVAAVFTAGILVVALVVFVAWLFVEPSRALWNALALLVVSCPCALAMATPLALSAASAQAARRRILLMEVSALERLARPCDVFLDKTGTLTRGRLSVDEVVGDLSWIPLLVAAEGHSAHPVARAVRERFGVAEGATGGELAVALEDVTEVPGAGLSATMAGKPVLLGAEAFVGASARSAPPFVAAVRRSVERGASPLLLSVDGEVVLVVSLVDAEREGVVRNLRSLRSNGHRLHLLSGDHPRAVESLVRRLEDEAGESLFTTATGGMRPLDKLARVESALAEGREVVMVGDGVNDAAALTRAGVGISVHGAAEASRLSADVFLGGGGVAHLAELFEGARRTLATIRRGMVFSLLYNVVGVTLAASGKLSPLWAAVLMPLSSLTVVSNAYRSRLFPKTPSVPEEMPR